MYVFAHSWDLRSLPRERKLFITVDAQTAVNPQVFVAAGGWHEMRTPHSRTAACAAFSREPESVAKPRGVSGAHYVYAARAFGRRPARRRHCDTHRSHERPDDNREMTGVQRRVDVDDT